MNNSLIEKISTHAVEANKYYDEVEKYYKKLDLKTAIKHAAEGRVPVSCNGKRTKFADHQHRVGKKNCELAVDYLLTANRVELFKIAQSFKDVFAITEEVRMLDATVRLGDLWSYDTAQRISFNLGFYPDNVYLQRGSKAGAYELANRGFVDSKKMKSKRCVEKEVFPEPLSNEEPYIIENLLCVGKNRGWFK